MIAKSIELTIGQLRDGDGGDNDDGYGDGDDDDYGDGDDSDDIYIL